jgi:hypothetical protein
VANATTRPQAPLFNPNSVEHRRLIADRANIGLPKDGSEGMSSPLPLASYAVADVPTASLWTNSIIYVSDETGGATLAFSDGSSWRRVTDRAVVS